MPPRYPALYQINTRVWLTELSRGRQRRATLDDIPDEELDRLAALGFDWIWMLSVWQTGPAAREVSRRDPDLRREFLATLPDLREEDIAGSGFAIAAYTVHEGLGGDGALARLRRRLKDRGLKLMLDFVPNHLGLDHPWVEIHPERFVAGTEADLQRAPHDYARVKCADGDLILASGRDPNFPGWSDTLQLDYSNPDTQEMMLAELLKVAGQCDGVRCDMAMLLLPDVFERTWGRRPAPFWPRATEQVRQCVPGFCFMAEVYWDLEWTLQQQGFDYAYDKRLYDRLRDRRAGPVRGHLLADLRYQDKLARFLENHDEPRAAAVFPREVHEAAGVITFLSPGLRFFHQGQLDGRTRRVPAHLERAPAEAVDAGLREFYARLLAVLRMAPSRSPSATIPAPVMLRVTGGAYTDEATGSNVSMGASDAMTAVLANIAAGSAVSGVQMTPLTSMAQAMALHMAGGMTSANIATANAAVGAYFVVDDILYTPPMNPLVAGSGSTAAQGMVNYGMTLAAMSQYAKNVGMPASSTLVTYLMADASDGTMDGSASGSQIMMGGTMMGGAMMQRNAGTSGLAGAMSDFLGSGMNQSGVPPANMSALMRKLMSADGQMH
jgi:hypothetical protein